MKRLAKDSISTLLPRQARYATFRARGLSRADAAREAGYRGSSDSLKVTAARLERRPAVRTELQRYAEHNYEVAIVSRSEVLEKLARIIRADFGDLITLDPQGHVWLNLPAAVRALGAGEIHKLSYSPGGRGFSIRTDRDRAIRMIIKMQGWDRPVPEAKEDLTQKSDSELYLTMLPSVIGELERLGWLNLPALEITPIGRDEIARLLNPPGAPE